MRRTRPLPGWTRPEIASIQKQLSRLGTVHVHRRRQTLGASTQSGLIEAFGLR